MYFPIGWPRHLKVSKEKSSLIHICGNRDKGIFAILFQNTISLWNCKPAVEICCVRRSDNSVHQFGTNLKAEWKPDNSILVVSTSKGYILFYSVEFGSRGNPNNLYSMKEEKRIGSRRDVLEVHNGRAVPALKLVQSSYRQIPGGANHMAVFRDELIVATGHGELQRLRWDGTVIEEATIRIADVPFSIDFQHAKAPLSDKNVTVVHIQHISLLAGFAVVLSNGRAAFLSSNTFRFEPSGKLKPICKLSPKEVVGVWANDITQATCIATNYKYSLIAFGCRNGEASAYSRDDLTGALTLSHKFVVQSKDFPDAGTICGEVVEMKWTSDGCALAMAWKKGGFSLWSVFGSLLTCCLGCDIMMEESRSPMFHISSMEWDTEGYNLWIISNGQEKEANGSIGPNGDLPSCEPQLLQLNFIKSAITVNPCASNHQHLFLQGEDKLYLSTDDPIMNWTSTDEMPRNLQGCPILGNRQWQILPIPFTYVNANWPIRFSAVNSIGNCVAVAGKNGLAHYSFSSRKWKLFGNETQERDMLVTGGLLWWKDFIVVACFNILDQREELRFYPQESKLDNTFAHVIRVPSQMVLLNTFHNILIILCLDCHIMIFRMERKSTQNTPVIEVNKMQEVAIGNFLPHPATVAAINLSTLRTETANLRVHPQAHEAESIILNAAGRLLMFQRDRSGPSNVRAGHKEHNDRPLPFCAPVMVASSVEVMWAASHPNSKKPHLTEALWLGCGAFGMKVWLPLHPREDGRTRGFLSKRIMLPFQANIYPLALMCEAGIILGAASETLSHYAVSLEVGWSYMQLERTSQIAIHHILRQLLRRNLGVHALELARCCIDLPHFSHALELLLHEVLEEEATSKEPIPDPLLPRVAAFVQEFPEYLQTVVHCARKTEVALWQYLFNTVGDPVYLFKECLEKGNLRTAASYLIILQNMEQPSVSRQQATKLLDAALEHCLWDLARELVRFLRAIDPSESECPHPSAFSRTNRALNAAGPYPYHNPVSPPLSPTDGAVAGGPPLNSGSYYYNANNARGRSVSVTKDDVNGTKDVKEKLTRTKSDTQSVKRSRHPSVSKDENLADHFFIDTILHRHARKLLSVYKLRDLALFAANLEEYQLVGRLKKERLRAARVDDFVVALTQLHKDFRWPYPIVSISHSRLEKYSPGLSHQPSTFDKHSMIHVSTDYPTLVPVNSDVFLQPNIASNPSETNSTATNEPSENSSAQEDLDDDSVCDIEQISHELANKGPERSEVELRFLLQIMMEAGCLEWALLISVLLRDEMEVVRTVNTACMTDTPIDIITRMKEGIDRLQTWADSNCLGYQPFLYSSINTQILQLKKLAEDMKPSMSPRGPLSRQVSRDAATAARETNNSSPEPVTLTPVESAEETNGGLSPEIDEDEEEEDEEEDEEVETQERSTYECIVT